MNMKQMIASLTIFIFVLCFAAFTFATDKSVKAVCSNATVKGSYGFYRFGTTPDGPLSAAGIAFFDGNGHTQIRQRISRNGTHGFVVISLEYSVAKDCTYKGFFEGNDVLSSGVVVDNGNRIFALDMTEGNTVSGVWEKIHK